MLVAMSLGKLTRGKFPTNVKLNTYCVVSVGVHKSVCVPVTLRHTTFCMRVDLSVSWRELYYTV